MIMITNSNTSNSLLQLGPARPSPEEGTLLLPMPCRTRAFYASYGSKNISLRRSY